MKKAKIQYVPVLKTVASLNEEAKHRIAQERSGKQLGLYTRFTQLNRAVGKYFRFGQVTAIAGLSGHGKSTILNMLLQDFENPELNGIFKEKLIIVHNSFEMSPVDELLRDLGGKTGRSHLNLLSSEFVNGEYNRLSDEEFRHITETLDNSVDTDHYYFDEPTDINGIIANINVAIKHFQEKYQVTYLPKVVLAIDHTLLIEGEDGDNVIDTMTRIGKLAIALKKSNYLVLLVGQLNGNIESPERLKNMQLHYPQKSDIYAQAQIYNAADNVLIIHQPTLIGIKEYGNRKLITHNLIHLFVLKQRFGKVGSIWLRNALDKGQFIELSDPTIRPDLERRNII
jgi:replicative DNA helicase